MSLKSFPLKSLSHKSETTTPNSLYSSPASKYTIGLPFNLISGEVVSITFTVLINDDLFPEESSEV